MRQELAAVAGWPRLAEPQKDVAQMVDRRFRVELPLWFTLGMVLCAMMALVLAAALAVAAVTIGRGQHPPPATALAGCLVGSLISLLNAVLCAHGLVRRLTEARRGEVVLDGSGIRAIDGRRRERALSWQSIEYLRVVRCGGLLYPSLITIGSAAGRLRIPPFVGARSELLQEIISRAGLRLERGNWYERRYVAADAAGAC